MKSREVMEIIRSAIRPFLVVSFATIFLWVVCKVANQFLDASIAAKVFDAFTYTMTLIIGVYIGGRIAKNPESK